MDAFVVDGLAGEAVLSGTVVIEGAKNAVLPIMAAALVMDGETKLSNVPDIADVHSMISLLEGVGAYGTYAKGGTVSLRTQDARGTILDEALAKRLRASVLLTGAVLAKNGTVTFPHPGGCVLGSRPIDLFLDGFRKLGCSVSERSELYTVTADNGLSGGSVFFRVPSVTATETFMIAAVKANAPVTLENCAMEPEVVALADFLAKSGAVISGAGTPTIIIHPSHLEPPEEPFAIIPDRIEAGSFLILGALLGKSITIEDIRPDHLKALIESLRAMEVPVDIGQRTVTVSRPPTLRPIEIRTHEYPGFPTDLQAPMMILLTQVEGESSVIETIFDGRLNYVDDLVRMGADVRVWNPHKAIVKGPTPLKARDIDGPDIRAGLAFLLAAAVAVGQSRIGNAGLIDRGYAKIEEKLSGLGLNIKRVQ